MKIHATSCIAGLTLAINGAAHADELEVPKDARTIQGAIDLAEDGDEIIVAPGVYAEAIDFLGKSITVRSSDGYEATTIDGTGFGTSVVTCVFDTEAAARLEGFTITGGVGSPNSDDELAGGGLYCQYTGDSGAGVSLHIEACRFSANSAEQGGGVWSNWWGESVISLLNCVFDENTAAARGGGLYLDFGLGQMASIVGCEFTNNSATVWGGGAYLNSKQGLSHVLNCSFQGNTTGERGGGLASFGHANVADCSFSSNSAAEDGGGSFFGEDQLVTVSNCTFTMNTASDAGGGLFSLVYSNTIEIVDCTFIENTATMRGGGLAGGDEDSQITVIRCTFDGNQATDPVVGRGGGVYGNDPDYSDLTVRDSVFRNNHAAGSEAGGGGLYWAAGGEGGQTTWLVEVSGCLFENNSAVEKGGGLDIRVFGSAGYVANCVFRHNTARIGGGMQADVDSSQFSDEARVIVASCLFDSNFAEDRAGGAYITGNTTGGEGDALITGCTFYDNEAEDDTGGGLFHNHNNGVTLDVSSSIFRRNSPDQIDNSEGGLSVAYCSVEAGYAGEGNISGDPLFEDPTDGDFRLRHDSPCIDAGDNASFELVWFTDTDLDERGRFVDDPDTPDTGAGDAPIVDMGAYEFQTGPACISDLDGDGEVGPGDLAVVLGSWGEMSGDADLNGDGVVGAGDLAIILGNWGPC